MKYVCFVYGEEPLMQTIDDRECLANGEALRQAGHYVAAESLQPASRAATARVRNGKVSVTDGPFAEAKEMIAGFYLIEARISRKRLRSPPKSRRLASARLRFGPSGSLPAAFKAGGRPRTAPPHVPVWTMYVRSPSNESSAREDRASSILFCFAFSPPFRAMAGVALPH